MSTTGSRFTRPRPSYQGNRTPPQKVGGYLMKYHLAPVENENENYIELALTHDVMRSDGTILKAEFDADRMPTTIVKMFHKMSADALKKPVANRPRTISGLADTRGSGGAVTPGGIVQFDGVFHRRDDVFVAEACHGWAAREDLAPATNAAGQEKPAKRVFLGDVHMLIQRTSKKDQDRFDATGEGARQKIYLLETHNAVVLEADENGSYMAKLLEMLTRNNTYAATLGVAPAFAIIARSKEQHAPEYSWLDRIGHYGRFISRPVDENKREYRLSTPEETLASFLEYVKGNEGLAPLAEVIEGAAQEEYTLTYVPGLSPVQGANLNPWNYDRSDPDARRPFDMSMRCRVFDAYQDEATGETNYTVYCQGFSPGLVRLGYNKKGNNYMVDKHEFTIPSLVYPPSDLPTPDMADWHLEAVTKLANDNRTMAREFISRERNRANANNQQQGQQQTQQQAPQQAAAQPTQQAAAAQQTAPAQQPAAQPAQQTRRAPAPANAEPGPDEDIPF